MTYDWNAPIRMNPLKIRNVAAARYRNGFDLSVSAKPARNDFRFSSIPSGSPAASASATARMGSRSTKPGMIPVAITTTATRPASTAAPSAWESKNTS